MLGQTIRSLASWARRVATLPRRELDRWQRKARFAIDMARYGGRQLQQDRAPQMAGALAFRSLFALVPVLIVAMIVVKSLRGTDEFLQLTNQLFLSLNLDDVHVLPPANGGGASDAASMSLAEWLQGLVAQAAAVNLGAVGWVGVAVIGYAAISLMVTIENSFNAIYRAPTGRPWTRRLPLYWFVLTVSPVLIGVGWYVKTYGASWIETAPATSAVLAIVDALWNLLVGWLVILAVYLFLPNTNVRLRPAAVGALVAAMLWEIGRNSLAAYLENVFAIGQLYGSLGLVPLFMFWVYLMWLATLFGLEVSAALQALGGRNWEELDPQSTPSGLLDPAVIVTAAEVVAERFAAGEPTTARQIAEDASLPENLVVTMLTALVEAKIVFRVAGNDAVILAKPPEKVTADELLQIGFHLVDHGRQHHNSHLVDRLRDVQRKLVAETSLATLLADQRATT